MMKHLASSQHFFNKHHRIACVNGRTTSVVLSKTLSLSVFVMVLNNNASSVLYQITNTLAMFGILADFSTYRRRHLVRYTGFFHLADFSRPTASFVQFLGFLSFLVKYKSSTVRPISLSIGSMMFSLANGITLLSNLSNNGGFHNRIAMYLNPIRLFLVLLQQIILGPFRLVNVTYRLQVKDISSVSLNNWSYIYKEAEAISLTFTEDELLKFNTYESW